MRTSTQQPLTGQSTHEHNFSQSVTDWEASVFDRAAYFAVIELRYGSTLSERRKYTTWTNFPWAVRYARRHLDACIYAVTDLGRFNNLDREKWSEWETRWWRNRKGDREFIEHKHKLKEIETT